MKLITHAELKPLVVAEAINLKANAFKKEIARLDFSELDTDSIYNCIYGQMTGECNSERAVKLITKSCDRVITPFTSSKYGVNGSLNGSPKGLDRFDYWSPIEVFIDRKINKTNGNNKRLIKFLKGENKTLRLI